MENFENNNPSSKDDSVEDTDELKTIEGCFKKIGKILNNTVTNDRVSEIEHNPDYAKLKAEHLETVIKVESVFRGEIARLKSQIVSLINIGNRIKDLYETEIDLKNEQIKKLEMKKKGFFGSLTQLILISCGVLVFLLACGFIFAKIDPVAFEKGLKLIGHYKEVVETTKTASSVLPAQ